MSINRLWNTRNPAQGPAKKVLALCSAGLLRSPTVAWVLGNDPWNYNTRAAGVSPEFALIGVDEFLLCWADEVVCVEQDITDRLNAYCDEQEIDLKPTPVITLNIPDRFQRRSPELVQIIVDQYNAATKV